MRYFDEAFYIYNGYVENYWEIITHELNAPQALNFTTKLVRQGFIEAIVYIWQEVWQRLSYISGNTWPISKMMCEITQTFL